LNSSHRVSNSGSLRPDFVCRRVDSICLRVDFVSFGMDSVSPCLAQTGILWSKGSPQRGRPRQRVECGNTLPLSHWETCLPVPKRGHVRARQVAASANGGHVSARQGVLDCGGKRSATPLWHARKPFAVRMFFARPKAPAPPPLCRRSPKAAAFRCQWLVAPQFSAGSWPGANTGYVQTLDRRGDVISVYFQLTEFN
jgi:hypothetical protein